MNKNKNKKKSKVNVKGIILSKGFYITLATLIIVFGTAAVVRKLTGNVKIEKPSFDEVAWTEAAESAELENNEEELERSLEEIYYEPDEIEEIPQMTQPTVAVNSEMTDDEIIGKLSMAFPVDGEIIRKHSPDEHVYYKTMNDWRTHNGIDIAAEEGMVVSAAADGVVEKVYEDNKLGVVVEIGHEGGIKTRYANLEDINFIEVGRKVAKGDAIGSVGKSSIIEGKDKSHIHFEVMQNEESCEPSDYIKI